MNHSPKDLTPSNISVSERSATEIPLGKSVQYPAGYDVGLLFPIPRSGARLELGLGTAALPFIGWDLWNAYEMSWLNPKGLPQVAILRVIVPCTSPNIIESKSFKLYLNGFNQTHFNSQAEVLACLQRDLSEAAQEAVKLEILDPQDFASERIEECQGINLDQQDIEATHYSPDPGLLGLRIPKGVTPGEPENIITESVYSRLLKSNCPVTQQPDWACVQIQYTGCAIDHASLLQYIVSFRIHNGFHENCVERMFVDISERCKPQALSIYARYTRRGGLDINPWRATEGMSAPARTRSARQ